MGIEYILHCNPTQVCSPPHSAGMGLVVQGVWGHLVRISTALVALSVLLGCAACPWVTVTVTVDPSRNLLCPQPGSPPPVQPSLLCHNQSQQLWSCSLLQAGSSAAGGAEEDGQEKGVSGAGWGGDRAGRESVLSRRRDGIQWIPQRDALPSSPGSALGPAEGSGEERGQEEALGQKSLNNEEEQLISSVELMNWTGEILPSCVNKPSSQRGSCSWSSWAEAAGDGSIKM